MRLLLPLCAAVSLLQRPVVATTTSGGSVAAALLAVLLGLPLHSATAFVSLTTTTTTTTTTPTTSTLTSQILRLPTSTSSLSAKNAEEDLELTRQIVLSHVKNRGGDTSDYLLEEEEVEKEIEEKEKPTSSSSSSSSFNDLMIRAALGQEVERTPVWLFRQAGRHLPEYNAYKQSTDFNFLELLSHPECVAECTLQPVRRYPLDAAILFSDILVIPEALGIEVTMPGGVGIQVPNPLQSRSDISRIPPLESLTRDFVEDKLGHVLEAVRQIRAQLKQENIQVPLIGFSAAPWTLMYYMVGGSSKKNTDKGVWWLETYPVASQEILDKLTKVVIEYLSAQVDNGCQLLQIFEAMSMMIDDGNFVKYALPCLEKIGRELKVRHPNVPLMVFCRGSCHLNDKVAALGCFDVITMDGSVDRAKARQQVGSGVSLQGNYDPAELIPANGKTIESVKATAKQLLEELGPQRLIANLGEGLGGKESPELVDAFVNAIHEESAKMIRAAAAGPL